MNTTKVYRFKYPSDLLYIVEATAKKMNVKLISKQLDMPDRISIYVIRIISSKSDFIEFRTTVEKYSYKVGYGDEF